MTQPKPKKRSLKKRLSIWLLLHLGPPLVWFYANLVGRTSRWIVINNNKHLAMFHKGESYIAAIWHNRALMMPFIYKTEGGKNVIAMVSSSTDGQFTSSVLKRFGFKCALGSSTRGGKEAMREMIAAAKNQNYAMTITPDGPLGPNQVVKMGAIALAKETGLPIVSVSYYAKKVYRFKSWDRFILVWPFNTIAAIGSELRLHVPADASDEDMEKYRRQLEDEMNRISQFAEDYFAGKASLSGLPYFFSKVSFFTGKPHWTRPDGSTLTVQDLIREYEQQ
jgi:hypothetical protein